ncbi:hypothetical protein, partial [Brevundimonas sp. ZS04]|uniref:hypothetical protein n=1 Tax=Brevundimonas sp. ZS04 TaxID=1906854 RepID=UPI001E61B78F
GSISVVETVKSEHTQNKMSIHSLWTGSNALISTEWLMSIPLPIGEGLSLQERSDWQGERVRVRG